jgi:hypothetical protein
MIQPSLTSDPQLLRAFQTTQCELSGKLFLHVTIRMKDGTRHVGQLVGMQSTNNGGDNGQWAYGGSVSLFASGEIVELDVLQIDLVA